MANTPSQVKRHRQSLVRRQRNKAVRSALKTHMKRFRQAAEAGDRTQAEAAYRSAARQLDKAAQKGVVHANFAANKKSKMAHELSELQPGPASP
ncbi:MAG: 30S ribosomal protein S20 [Actinomycetota bacterium]|nr:30S ribosomal protein S20 [Actinomycetota bacterium]